MIINSNNEKQKKKKHAQKYNIDSSSCASATASDYNVGALKWQIVSTGF